MRHWGVQSVQEAAQDENSRTCWAIGSCVAVATLSLSSTADPCAACLLAGLGTDWYCYVPILIIPVLCGW